MCSSTGVPTTGTSGLGMRLVSGRSRAPSPPAMTTAFTQPPPRHRSAMQIIWRPAGELRAWRCIRSSGSTTRWCRHMKRSRSSSPSITIGHAKSAASRRAATRSRSRERRLLHEPAERARDLGRIVGLHDDRVAVRAGILLAGRSHHRDPAGGHRLEAHQPERLVTGVGEHRSRRHVDLGDHLVGKEPAQVHDRRAVGLGECTHDPTRVGHRLMPVDDRRARIRPQTRARWRHMAPSRRG